MNKEELREGLKSKVENIKNGKVKSEIFNISRPPEDFGDAVELFYNDQEQCFKAVVFDPQTTVVFSEEKMNTIEDACSFIIKTVK
ncbi:hypothetical protein [Alkalihalobacterium alkalinitrilicum]|uniref:hypothetical protein n=1 Tax=Alkalihalobacterium alkalinitrilicum TaxID=427920 RepID=UPI0009957713|nr:hypothetical protein [Alkalihalobacterium alkalinitrilicum]